MPALTPAEILTKISTIIAKQSANDTIAAVELREVLNDMVNLQAEMQAQGTPGLSAYQLYAQGAGAGALTESAWLQSLNGGDGAPAVFITYTGTVVPPLEPGEAALRIG